MVVGKLTRPSVGLTALSDLQPDLLVTSVDTAPPEPDMASYLAQAFDAAPGLRIVVLSERTDARRIDEAFAAGAAAFVTRSATTGELATAIRHAFRPTVYLAVTQQLDREVEPLTHRELEVLQLTAQGRSNVEIARILWVTEQTVKFHLSNVYRKLGVANRTEASRWASAQGLTSDLARSE